MGVDDHERDQRDQPEQRARGRSGGEGAPVRERVHEQDRARHHRQARDQPADPRPEAARRQRRAHHEARRQQQLDRE
jgi:hypothetical protein